MILSTRRKNKLLKRQKDFKPYQNDGRDKKNNLF
jgi:hypothetical protein